ncbi:nucleotide exchange factor GrpE [Halomonas binhaiensis]|uniref:Protein GrpE n=1 Tax=Halomonas binhaiensis TaxID=2562282 RepID=A0A5C1NLY9_9GAMM|nr:nucleotide exchange factor GrpE [Halomonas binhaiensis]QEM83428.1 nucleotide exchange factor GrpE [Halomonas binhaiensis]
MAKDPHTQQEEELANSTQAAEVEGEDTPATQGEEVVAEQEAGHEALVEDEGIVEDPEMLMATRVEELEQDLAEAKDQLLRTAAEAQNVRRRAEAEAEKARKFALEKFIKEMLPVVDSLEKALESMGSDAAEVHREGVSMTLKMQLDVLGKFGVEVLEPQGEPFDPQLHEAMAMVPNPAVDPNTVIDVMQKGYVLNGRLVRPAMVVVSQTAG